jgi:putative phosphoribosyl transferase
MTDGRRYADRDAAGDALAAALPAYRYRDGVVVLGLPRGGVPVAARVAAALSTPLDVLLVRKLGLPGHAELAMGAVAMIGGEVVTVPNEDVVARAGVDRATFAAVRARETAELQIRASRFRAGRPPLSVDGRAVIVVDDGLATGATMRAALAALHRRRPASIAVAVPVAPADTLRALRPHADDVVCPWVPERFRSVSEAYADFSETSDEEVRRLLEAD